MEKLGIYIHIPFCESKCYYCDFVSFRKTEQEKCIYVDCLINEIKYKAKMLKNYEIDTIFVGGGTPSCLPSGCLLKIFNELRMSLSLSKNCEISIEANPNSITKEFACEIEKCGVNRISIGLQSCNDELLKLINRIHTSKDFVTAIDIINKNTSIKNINVDLMIGLPNQTIFDVTKSIDFVKDKVTHISCYGLILEENTKLFDMVKNNKIKLPDEDVCNKMYQTAYDKLNENGYHRYEVSNFCKMGFECKHNLKYWNREEYVGFGLNASSFINGERFSNQINFNKYISDYKDMNNIIDEKLNIEKLSKNDEIDEFVMLSLRTKYGLDTNKLATKYNYDILKTKQNQIKKLTQNDFIKLGNNTLKVTDKGLFVLNQIILELLCD